MGFELSNLAADTGHYMGYKVLALKIGPALYFPLLKTSNLLFPMIKYLSFFNIIANITI